MKPGDKLRVRGPNGNVFRVTVGTAFPPESVKDLIESGRWTLLDEAKPARRRRKTDVGEQAPAEQASVDE